MAKDNSQTHSNIIFFILFGFMGSFMMFPLTNIIFSGMETVDIYSDEVIATYYSKNKIIDIDSVSTVFNYNLNRTNKYINELREKGQPLDSTEVKDISNFYASYKRFADIDRKIYNIFNEKVRKEYKPYDLFLNLILKFTKLTVSIL
ncbi:hypothetical protein HNV11_08395 [Spirosoma taeanense]|uniref:Uncharacterized protein n=1 Tax=Spirosoma taeanense TaxID=2735870 RepID=A0A6M5Y9D3_9BACT|nr:hypothetical protein [Spirosoma taeanense]QJW89402.1 hypothetical protein HNV11_08395 [Spirosoma taeanense]